MLPNPGFYLTWAVIAVLPLMIAFLGSETWGKKFIAILVALAITFGVATLLYKNAEGNRKSMAGCRQTCRRQSSRRNQTTVRRG